MNELQWAILAAVHHKVAVTLFWCCFGFWEYFGACSSSNCWARHLILSKRVYTSYLITKRPTVWSQFFHYKGAKHTSQRGSMWYSFRKRDINSSSFFILPFLLKGGMVWHELLAMFCETKYVVLDGCCLIIVISWGSQTPERPVRHSLLSKQGTPSQKIRAQLDGIYSLTLPSPKLWWYSERFLLRCRRVSARWKEFIYFHCIVPGAQCYPSEWG